MTQIDLYDDRSLDKSPKKNWVEKAGGLPPNVRARARAIKRENPDWPLSRCISTAINANKHATATGGDLHFKGRQQEGAPALGRHVKATAQWEALKLKNKASKNKRGVNLSESKEETQPTVTISSIKKTKKAKKGTKADVGSSKSKLHDAIKRFKEKGGDPKGKEAARLKSSKQRLGEKGKLNLSEQFPNLFVNIDLSDGPKGTDARKHDKIFLQGRRTPEVVPKGSSSKKKLKVKKRKPATTDDEKKIGKGDWLREDSSGRKPGQDGYISKNASKGPDANKVPKKNKRSKVAGRGNPLR